MSSLYLSTSGSSPSSGGVWRVSASEYQYIYSSFTAGEDVNLDQVSVKTNTYDAGQSAPTNFQVGIYEAGADALTPGSLISYLSGPGSPDAGSYNTYTPTGSVALSSGTQYWLGFTIASDNGGTNDTRVKVSSSSGDSSYLGSGWSYGQRYLIGAGTGSNGNSDRPATFQIYGSSRAVCFCSGTLIMTPEGEKKIDEINIGDLACTSNGSIKVKWVARRTVSRFGVSKKTFEETLPVRIRTGSLGNGLPSRDLLVSDSHGICVDGTIVNACYLINGLNIYKDDPCLYPNEIKYLHLEFDEEVLVLANGVQACSYVNNGNRRSFDNYPEFISMYVNPELSVKSLVSKSPRTQPSLEGRKDRIRRSWQAA